MPEGDTCGSFRAAYFTPDKIRPKKTMKDNQPTLERLHKSMIRENRSAANYAKGEPMRSVIWKRAENATRRYEAANARATGNK